MSIKIQLQPVFAGKNNAVWVHLNQQQDPTETNASFVDVTPFVETQLSAKNIHDSIRSSLASFNELAFFYAEQLRK